MDKVHSRASMKILESISYGEQRDYTKRCSDRTSEVVGRG
jgi:hypothetical protein